MAKLPILRLTPPAAAAVHRGHPWVFKEGVAGRIPPLAPGDYALLDTGDARFGAYVDPTSPILVRVLTGPGAEPSDAVVQARFKAALARRAALFDDNNTTAFRLCHGEGDRLPGVVADRYGDIVVIRLDGHGAEALFARVRQPLLAALADSPWPPTTVLLRARPEKGRGGTPVLEVLVGDKPSQPIWVREHGMAMEVDVVNGQKTGAFLDQRENRRRVRTWSRGRPRVLNLYSYAGGFSVAAALGGAQKVVSVDIAAGGHASAQRSFRENNLNGKNHSFVTADVLTYLANGAADQAYDLIISDPPSFAPSEKAKKKALGAYRRLHAMCAAALAPGGRLCAASCSSHVSLEEFLTTLDARSLGRSDLVVAETFGPPADHPTVAAFPEGRYLKMVVLDAPAV